MSSADDLFSLAERRLPRIFTVPPGRPFLTCLARAILNGDLPQPGGSPPDPITLPDITLLMPTRRATRSLQEAFLAAGQGRAMLLPQIRPISEGDEELTLLSSLAGLTSALPGASDLPPAIPEIHRRLALTSLVMRWSAVMRSGSGDETGELGGGPVVAAGANTPAQAAMLAADLAKLIDLVETEGASFAGLKDLVPEDFSEHWQKTLQFMEIVTAAWPAYLEDQGLLSPMDRRNKLIAAETQRLIERPPQAPVIVAGVTGSIPATADLIRAVTRLPHGVVVLPALDLDLNEESWDAIAPQAAGAAGHPEHPQFGLKKLLDRLGVARRDVRLLPGAGSDPKSAARGALMSEAMRPSATTGKWHNFVAAADRPAIRDALAGVSLIEAPGAQDEAEVVALILREAAETPGRTAALVSPDRLLARRVAIRLEAWGIRVDDSAGRPFPKTVPGAFLDLLIEAVAKDFAPAELMALLKHPLTRLGLRPFEVRRAARALEIAAFRAPYLGRGLQGVEAALKKSEEARLAGQGTRALLRLFPEDMAGAGDLVRRLTAAVDPLATLYARREAVPLRTLTAAHLKAAENMVAQPADENGDERPSELYLGEAGQAAARLFAGFADPALPDLAIPAADYADLYRGLVAKESVRPKIPVHPRLFIWGPFEARLQQADVMVLGSLNDGTWPESADPGPWLNRPMRGKLGLPSPEEKLGYAAHDFTSFAGAPKVYLTRALKVDGVPTVESRWLLRLKALLSSLELSEALAPRRPWLAWARARDAADARIRLKAPAPRPAAALRPKKLSVSAVERWIANPYAVYASAILKLEALPPVGSAPDAALRGGVVHEALARFVRKYPVELPSDTALQLLGFARQVLLEYTGHPRIAAFWLPRLERFAQWFAETEPERRRSLRTIVAEVSGQLPIPSPGEPFTLTARADRIDLLAGGEAIITDYKTGTPPPDKRVNTGEAPQLPLEAAIAMSASGFAGVSPARVTALRYIRASGGQPAGVQHDVKCDVAALAEQSVARLTKLVADYSDPATPYTALRRARFNYDYDDFAHLARVAEWAGETPHEEGPEQ